MKFLIQHVFAHKHPFYMLTMPVRMFMKQSHHWRKVFWGQGKIKKGLFDEKIYDGLEFDAHNTDIFYYNSWQIDWNRVNKFIDQGIPFYAVHGHYSANEKNPEMHMNLAYASPKIVEGLKAHITLTSKLVKDHPILVFHPGIVPMNMPADLALENVAENLNQCVGLLKETGVTICLENVNPYPSEKLKTIGGDCYELEKIINLVDSPYVKIVFDWGHANTYARWFYERHSARLPKDYLLTFQYHHEVIELLKKHIVYLHLNYNPAHVIEKAKPRLAPMWDFHQGLDRIPEKEREAYKEVLEEVYFNTPFKEYGGRVLLEIHDNFLLSKLGASHFGTDNAGAIKSVELLRSWFLEFEKIKAEKVKP